MKVNNIMSILLWCFETKNPIKKENVLHTECTIQGCDFSHRIFCKLCFFHWQTITFLISICVLLEFKGKKQHLKSLCPDPATETIAFSVQGTLQPRPLPITNGDALKATTGMILILRATS